MKNNTSKLIVIGIIVLVVFTAVLSLNLIPNFESNSYFVKVDEEMSAKIKSVKIDNGLLTISTEGDPIEYCVKSTRTTPKNDSLCWKKVTNNKASISVFINKKYYVWLKDDKNNVSNYLIVNSNDKK